jgi:hypothetical protein
MADLARASEADLSALNVDDLLDYLIELRTGLARLKALDERVLDRLSELVDAGELDPGGFSHADWSFTWSAGRRSWAYPEPVQTMEQQLKSAKKAAEADGTATATTGAPFWTIRAPKP